MILHWLFREKIYGFALHLRCTCLLIKNQCFIHKGLLVSISHGLFYGLHTSLGSCRRDSRWQTIVSSRWKQQSSVPMHTVVTYSLDNAGFTVSFAYLNYTAPLKVKPSTKLCHRRFYYHTKINIKSFMSVLQTCLKKSDVLRKQKMAFQ